MGFVWFECEATGKTPEEAFEKARERALADLREEARARGLKDPTWGIVYAGNILTKEEFVLIESPPGSDLHSHLDAFERQPWNEKWGNIAGCHVVEEIEGGQVLYKFFGVAPC